MAKRKLTPEILEIIEICAADEYALDEIREEADIVRPLMKDPQVIEAIEKGRTEWLIEIVATDGNIDSFIHYSEKTLDEVNEMFEIHKVAIEIKKAKLKTEKQRARAKKAENSAQTLDAAGRSGFNVYLQHDPRAQKKIDSWDIGDEISKVVKDLQKGDTSSLLEILVGNITQLHLFNGILAMNLSGNENITVDNLNKLSNMQFKLMQEERKSIMAINEITNPKRTTFIKEANQHNHLHQNSEKKDESENELQKLEQTKEPTEFTEAEVLPIKEKKK